LKYFLQIFFSGVVPFAFFLLAHQTGKGALTLDIVNILLKRIEIISFLILGITGLFGYAYFVGKEVKATMRPCYTLAQMICLLTSINSFAYAWTVNEWVKIVTSQYSSVNICTIDIFYSLIDLSSVINKALCIQFIFVTLFRRWLIPMGVRFQMTPPIGEILIRQGLITKEQLDKALEKQEKEGKGVNK